MVSYFISLQIIFRRRFVDLLFCLVVGSCCKLLAVHSYILFRCFIIFFSFVDYLFYLYGMELHQINQFGIVLKREKKEEEKMEKCMMIVFFCCILFYDYFVCCC